MRDSNATRALIFERQAVHVFLLSVLFCGLPYALTYPPLSAGSLWGVSTPTWFWWAVGIAIAHQWYVWFCWRLALHTDLFSAAIENPVLVFRLYAIDFSCFLVARIVLITILACSNRDTLGLPAEAGYVLAGILFVPAAYTLYSVARYFTFKRAMGIDHFDPAYRGKPLVREGIFRWTPNAIYTFGLCALWVPGLALNSSAAVLAALFSHLYIWVHYYCTEKPDMARIYGVPTG